VDRRGGFGRWGGSSNKGQKKENENGNGGGERWGRQRSEVSGGRWRRVAGKRGRGAGGVRGKPACRFFLDSAEVDWCRRFRLSGWEVLHVPQMSVIHDGGMTQQPTLVAHLAWSSLRCARRICVAASGSHFGRRSFLKRVPRIVLCSLRPPCCARVRAESSGLAVTLDGSPPIVCAHGPLRYDASCTPNDLEPVGN
jgi:hypothetical protein